jgi:hypothetical protein
MGPSYVAGLYDYDEEADQFTNPFGFGYNTTPKGSMQQDIFLDYAKHFVRHIEKAGQGKGKDPVFSHS